MRRIDHAHPYQKSIVGVLHNLARFCAHHWARDLGTCYVTFVAFILTRFSVIKVDIWSPYVGFYHIPGCLSLRQH